MDIKYIKIGEKYYVQVTALSLHRDDTLVIVEDEDGDYAYFHPKDFYPCPEGQEAPKYDPNRKFKAGDIVSPRFWCMRPPSAYYISDISGHFMPEDGLYEVDKDEMPDSTVLVKYRGKVISMQACHLELMTPVEGIEQYFIQEDNVSYNIRSKDECFIAAIIFKGIFENPMQLAKDTCDRLNAQHRKEQE